MSEENQLAPEPLNYSDQKASLECEKLKAEIENIRWPILKTPSFYTAMFPVALAILGLIFTQMSGWFDVQRTRIGNDKTLLEAQTERLKMERTILESNAKEQQARYAQAEIEVEKLKQRETNLTNQIANLNRERDELRLAKEFLENETKRLAGSDTKATQFLEQLKSLQVTRDHLSSDLQSLQASNAVLRVKTARQTALIRWANEVLSEGWSIALKDKATWAKFRVFRENILKIQTASMMFLPGTPSLAETRAAFDERNVRTYEDDLKTEQDRVLERATHKSYEDYIREAEEHFDLLNWVVFEKKNRTP